MSKVKTRLAKHNEVPPDFYPDYEFDYLLKNTSLAVIEIKFQNGFKYYIASSQFINYNSSTEVMKHFKENYYFYNLQYCSMLVNGAMNISELQEYISRDQNIILDYNKCEKLFNFYQDYYNEIQYVIQFFK